MDYLTKTIVLPVNGQEATVRQADFNSERLLFSNKERLSEALPKYWAKHTLKLGALDEAAITEDVVLDLLVPDQEALAMAIYEATNRTSKLMLTGECGGCGEPANYRIDLADLDVMPLPEDIRGPDPLFSVTLPVTGHRVEFGYLTGRQEQIEALKKNQDLFGVTVSAIRTVDGATPKPGEIGKWPLPDVRALRNAIKASRCGRDPRVRFTHGCGKAQVMNLLLDPSFLYPGLAG
jgi:hypothetical protein